MLTKKLIPRIIMATLLSSCMTLRAGGDQLRWVEVYGESMLSSIPIAISLATVVKENRATRRVMEDSSKIAQIDARLRNIDSAERSVYQHGVSAHIVCILHRDNGITDTLSFHSAMTSYRGVNYVMDTTLLRIVRNYVDSNVQWSIDELYPSMNKH